MYFQHLACKIIIFVKLCVKRKIEYSLNAQRFHKIMTEIDERLVITCLYTMSIPILITLSLITYQYNLPLLSKAYLGLAVYLSILTSPELYAGLDAVCLKTD